jgi:hypothetical protein
VLVLVVGLGLRLRGRAGIGARQQQHPRQKEQDAENPGLAIGTLHDKPEKWIPGTDSASVPGITGY